MTLEFTEPTAVSFFRFLDLKEDDLWACAHISAPGCAIFPHQGDMDLMGLSGSIRAGVILDHVSFVTGATSYGWGYDSCRPEVGSSAFATTSLTINGATVNFSDDVPVCPVVSRITQNGTLNMGAGMTIWIDITSPWTGKNITQSTIYIGHFILETKAADPVTTTSTPVQASTLASSSATSSTQTASSRIGGVPEGNISNSSTDTMQSRLPGIIGGTVTGIGAILIIFFLLWKRHQRRRSPSADVVAYDKQVTWSPSPVTNTPSSGYVHGDPYARGKGRPPSYRPPSSAPQPIHSQEGLLGGVFCPPSPSTQERHTFEMRPVCEMLPTQHNVSSVEHAISPATIPGGLPSYNANMNAPLIMVTEEEIVNDSLHEWAEETGTLCLLTWKGD